MNNINNIDWDTMPILLSVQEAGKVLRISPAKAYMLVTEPQFPRVRLGKSYKVSRDGLKKWLEKQIES